MEIRLIAEGEGQLCNDFQNRLHRTGRTLPQWQWTFAENNYHHSPIPYAIAKDGDRIVGTQALIPIRMADNDGIYWTAKSEESLIDPDYRGTGVFESLYELLFEYADRHEFAYIWGMTSSKAAIKALQRFGFSAPARTEQVFMPFWSRASSNVPKTNGTDPRKGLSGGVKTTALHTAYRLAKSYSSLKVALGKTRASSKLDIRTLDKPCEQAGDLCRRFVNTWGGTTIYRDAEYLQWRVFDNPYLRAVFKAFYRQEELAGWVAFAMGDDGMGYVVDLMIAGDESRHAAEQLIKTMLLESIIGTRNMGATGLRLWRVNNHPLDKLVYRAARSLGFYNIKRGDTCVLYNCAASAQRASCDRFDDWFVSRIITEGVFG
jgi:GNAT superfamily N-acetyltransferase